MEVTACCLSVAVPDRFWCPEYGGARPQMCKACALPRPRMVKVF